MDSIYQPTKTRPETRGKLLTAGSCSIEPKDIYSIYVPLLKILINDIFFMKKVFNECLVYETNFYKDHNFSKYYFYSLSLHEFVHVYLTKD